MTWPRQSLKVEIHWADSRYCVFLGNDRADTIEFAPKTSTASAILAARPIEAPAFCTPTSYSFAQNAQMKGEQTRRFRSLKFGERTIELATPPAKTRIGTATTKV